MKRTVVAAFVIAIAVATACGGPPSDAGATSNPKLSAEHARSALAGWLMNHSEAWVRSQAARVLDAKALPSADNKVSFGPWTCDLASRRFNAAFPTKHAVVHIEGELLLAPNGIWIARGMSHSEPSEPSK